MWYILQKLIMWLLNCHDNRESQGDDQTVSGLPLGGFYSAGSILILGEHAESLRASRLAGSRSVWKQNWSMWKIPVEEWCFAGWVWNILSPPPQSSPAKFFFWRFVSLIVSLQLSLHALRDFCFVCLHVCWQSVSPRFGTRSKGMDVCCTVRP